MATKKQETIIKTSTDGMCIWTSFPEKVISEIREVEGVEQVFLINGVNPLFVYTDPRYDIQEISQEIEALLASEVPDVFKDD